MHLGFAAQTPQGLVVPVVRDTDRLPLDDLAKELRRLTGLARRDELPSGLRTGATFTLNNYGVFDVDGATPILNHAQTAMLGVGRVVDRPWAVDGRVEVRKVVHLHPDLRPPRLRRRDRGGLPPTRRRRRHRS